MRATKVGRYTIVASILAAAGLAGSVAPAFADLSGTAGYEVEAKEQYCADGTTQCVPARGAPRLENLRFALVELYRLSSSSSRLEATQHNSTAAPEVLLAKCAGPHSIDRRGNIHSTTMSVLIGPSSQGLNPGTISGSVAVNHGMET